MSIHGEKLSADKDAADKFVSSFRKYVKDKNLSMDQIFNCDETGLYFRLLPDQTLAGSFEKSASGRKKSKDRVTINACSNASGTIMLPLHLIGKSKCPRCFKGMNMSLLPLKYSGQKNAWMNSGHFHDWFHNTFVPQVREKFTALGVECKAVLLLDNCSAHPDVKELVSDDGKITAMFLPPNVTSLIQPMDQGVLKALKLIYRKKLLSRLLIEDDRGESLVDFLKSINMKKVTKLITESWKEIKPETIRKSWQKIIPIPSAKPKNARPVCTSHSDTDSVSEVLAGLFDLAIEDSVNDESVTSLPIASTGSSGAFFWNGIRIRPALQSDSAVCDYVSDFQYIFGELGMNLDAGNITDWLECDLNDSGVQVYSDQEICDLVLQTGDSPTDGDDEDEEEPCEDIEEKCSVSNSTAAYMFEQCLSWLEFQPEASVHSTTLLRELHSLAATKRMDSLKQTSISKYFKS